MGRTSNLRISESVNDLNAILKLQTKHNNIDRIRALIHLKEGTFASRELVSDHLRISLRTLEKWISSYIKGGLDELLLPEKRVRKSYLISQEIDKALEKRMRNSEEGFSSYVEAQRWLSAEYGLDLKYNTIRKHLIRHYETKIKSPRKSHIKKDDEAIEAFLKTT